MTENVIEKLRRELLPVDKTLCEAENAFYALQSRVKVLDGENDRLRAALAQSDQPCAYCSLPADEWEKCESGFPGCARADDAMGCPELGASLVADELRAKVKVLEEALMEFSFRDIVFGEDEPDWMPSGIVLSCGQIRRARAALKGK